MLLLEGFTFAELTTSDHWSQVAPISSLDLIWIYQLDMIHFVWLSARTLRICLELPFIQQGSSQVKLLLVSASLLGSSLCVIRLSRNDSLRASLIVGSSRFCTSFGLTRTFLVHKFRRISVPLRFLIGLIASITPPISYLLMMVGVLFSRCVQLALKIIRLINLHLIITLPLTRRALPCTIITSSSSSRCHLLTR